MCWSGEASFVLAAVGIGATAYAAYKKEPSALYLTLGYFSLMELLQAFTYLVIDQCGNPWNEVLTLLGYIHIAFQPIFGNMMALYFIPASVRQRVAIPSYILCFASAIFMLVQLYPFSWAGTCPAQMRTLCGETLCSVSGSWHIAWLIPYNGLLEAFPFSFPTYVLTMFAIPLLYGSWRLVTYHFLMGPLLAYSLSSNPNEWPAVWCLLSIGFLLIVVKTPVRKYLHVNTWPLWPKSWR